MLNKVKSRILSGKKSVYFFGNTQVDGDRRMKEILGGKGANLAEMRNLGIPVPPGFTISTEICKYFIEQNYTYPDGLRKEVERNLMKLEKEMNLKLGYPEKLLLLSIRSGAAQSMPGMMDTILNLGLNDKVVDKFSETTKNPRFVLDAYRRLIQMFGNVAHNIDAEYFEEILNQVKRRKNLSHDIELTVEDLQEIVIKFKEAYKKYLGRRISAGTKKTALGSNRCCFWIME